MLCLTIPAWLNMDSEIFINFPLILIILSLSYIFILKLPTIVSAFREKTLPDILFVIIIFTSLFIPLSNMSREFTSDYEERINNEQSDIEYIAEYVNRYNVGELNDLDIRSKIVNKETGKMETCKIFQLLNAAAILSV